MGECDITVSANGPLRLTGKDIVIKDPAGKTFGLAGREVVSLCRCGASENKPFCDGAHKKVNFQSAPPRPRPTPSQT